MLCRVCISRTSVQNLKNFLDILKMLLLYNTEVCVAFFFLLFCLVIFSVKYDILNNESDLFRLCRLHLYEISSRA